MSDFGTALQHLLTQRGVSLREAARLTHYDASYLSKVINGHKPGSPGLAAVLDAALDGAGALSALMPPLTADDPDDRMTWAVRNPRRAGAEAAEALADVLAAQRRAEDTLGSATLLPAVTAQLRVAETLAGEARGPARNAVVDVAGQWAQFAGWLHASTGKLAQASRLYETTLCLATEAGDTDLIATALNMKGFISWLAARPGPMIGLSQAAQRDRGVSPGVRALAAQQEARGHAITGDTAMTERKLGEAQDLAAAAQADPEREPPWVYFFGSSYLTLQRARAYLYLGRHSAAAELLTGGLAGLAPGVRRSEWAALYLADLGQAHRALGDMVRVAEIADEVEGIAMETRSPRLARRVVTLR